MSVLRPRVCIVLTDAVSANSLCRGQLEYLRDSGCELTVVCGDSQGEIDSLKKRNIGNIVEVRLRRRPNLILDMVAFFQLLWLFVFRRFDVVLFSTPKAMLLAGVASALGFQARRIALVRGRVYENFVGLKRDLFRFADRVVFALAHKVIFISPSLKSKYSEEGICRSEKSFVLAQGSSNGVDVSRFDPLRYGYLGRKLRAELNLDDNHFVVVSVGRLCYDKGVVELGKVVDCLKEHRKVRFVVVGRIEDEIARDVVSRMVNEALIVHLDSADPVSVFAAGDAHLFLSHREGFGNVAIEAAAMGVPTISFDVVGIADSVCQGVSGVKLPFLDVEGVANTVLRLKCEPQFRANFSGAREWAVGNYSQERVWAFYGDLLARDSGSFS